MRQYERFLVLVFLASVLPAASWSSTNTAAQLVRKGSDLDRKAEKEFESAKYGNACKDFQKAFDMLAKAQEYGENVGGRLMSMHRDLGNCYAISGNAQSALKEYMQSEGAPTPSSGDVPPNDVIRLLGQSIQKCAVCGYSLPRWEALMYLYRVTGNTELATRTEQELDLHRRANDAYKKAYDKAFGVGKLNWLLIGESAAITGATQGRDTPKPDVQTGSADEKANKGAQMGWYAKMEVYKAANRPEYVQQCVQEMRNENSTN